MRRIWRRHRSRHLERDMEYLILGHGGAPVVVFPTSNGRCWQWEDFSMVGSVRRHVDNGWVQFFCLDSVDREALYNHEVDPRERILRHVHYERYVIDEFLPILRQENPVDFLIVTGTSFGAYHAVNFGLRHPDKVNRVLAMGGDYCIRKYLDCEDGYYYDLDVYYNCPVDFLPNLRDPRILDLYRRRLELILTSSDWDFNLGPTLRLAEILDRLEVPHTLDVWEGRLNHDWPAWRQMLLKYL